MVSKLHRKSQFRMQMLVNISGLFLRYRENLYPLDHSMAQKVSINFENLEISLKLNLCVA